MSVRRVYVAGGPTDGLNVEFVRGYVRRAGWVFETCERCDLVIVVPSALPSTVRWTELDVALRSGAEAWVVAPPTDFQQRPRVRTFPTLRDLIPEFPKSSVERVIL
jgi:hypothetical protein